MYILYICYTYTIYIYCTTTCITTCIVLVFRGSVPKILLPGYSASRAQDPAYKRVEKLRNHKLGRAASQGVALGGWLRRGRGFCPRVGTSFFLNVGIPPPLGPPEKSHKLFQFFVHFFLDLHL